MKQSLQADWEPWEASAYWEYPSFERRNMETIKLSSKLVGVLLSDLAACDRQGVEISPQCAEAEGLLRVSPESAGYREGRDSKSL